MSHSPVIQSFLTRSVFFCQLVKCTVLYRSMESCSHVMPFSMAGLLISFLELACTGQIYLPTIIFVSSIPELRGRAIFYLVLYNLMFIIPLIVVFILAFYGTTSKQLTEFLRKHAAAVKLGMAALFVALAAWLVFSLLA